MIKKEKVLNQIGILADSEKRLIPLLNRHVSSSLFFSGLDKRESDAIIERFQNIVLTCTKHVETLNGIKEEISKGKNDVY